MFADRRDAGRRLARRVREVVDPAERPIVLALPRGGVPVAHEVAAALDAPLDVFLVRKLGVPGHEELAMGAIATGGVRVLNPGLIPEDEDIVADVERREQAELERRERLYRGDRPPPDVAGRTVVVVDDGLATGATMHAALAALHRLGAGRLVAAVPVGARDTCRALAEEADDVVCAEAPEHLLAISRWYEDFAPTPDDEVCRLLAMSP